MSKLFLAALLALSCAGPSGPRAYYTGDAVADPSENCASQRGWHVVEENDKGC